MRNFKHPTVFVADSLDQVERVPLALLTTDDRAVGFNAAGAPAVWFATATPEDPETVVQWVEAEHTTEAEALDVLAGAGALVVLSRHPLALSLAALALSIGEPQLSTEIPRPVRRVQ